MPLKNKFRVEGGSVVVTLTQGKEALVDLIDWPSISRYRWYANLGRKDRTWYARTNDGSKTLLMHRVLCPGVKLVDHRDRDGLNNTRSNLREATPSQNAQNRKRASNNVSGFRGVSFDKAEGKFRAQIKLNGKQTLVAFTTSAEEAARAYDAAALRLFGEFAVLNFHANTVTAAQS